MEDRKDRRRIEGYGGRERYIEIRIGSFRVSKDEKGVNVTKVREERKVKRNIQNHHISKEIENRK